MKIIQITDMHIDAPGDDTYGVDVKQNFIEILEKAVAKKPDYLVLTGDLCHSHSHLGTYKWIKEHLDAQEIPYLVISGNHDLTQDLAEVFEIQDQLKSGELYYTIALGEEEIIFLDSSTYLISSTQLDWLKNQLADRKQAVTIFMHHPPCVAGVKFMDEKYPLKNWQEVQEVFLKCPVPVRVFCGHYHAEKTIHVQNLSVHITPSLYVQINSENIEFEADHYQTAFREIIFLKNTLVSEVRYFSGNKK